MPRAPGGRMDGGPQDHDDPLGFAEMPASVSAVMVAVMRLKRMFDVDNARILASLSDMREADWRILLVLHERGAMPQKDVIRRIQMEQGQASRSLHRLQEEGLVASGRDGGDRRRWNFELTAAGREALARVLPAMLARKREVDAAVSPEEMAQLQALLSQVAARLAADAPAREPSWDRTVRRRGPGQTGERT